MDILKQYANPHGTPTGDAFGPFDTAAQQSTGRHSFLRLHYRTSSVSQTLNKRRVC
jgi:hypothetical protein